MECEGMVARQEEAVLERHPGVADIAEYGAVQPAEIERQRPHASLDIEEREAVLEGAERVRLAEERASAIAPEDPHRSVHRVEDGADRVSRVDAAEREEMPLVLVAAGDATGEPGSEHVMERDSRRFPGKREEARVRGRELAEVEIRSERGMRDARGDGEPLALLRRDAADEAASVGIDVGGESGGDEPGGRITADDRGRVASEMSQLVLDG